MFLCVEEVDRSGALSVETLSFPREFSRVVPNACQKSPKVVRPKATRIVQWEMEGPQAAKDFVAASYFVNYEASSSTSSPAGQLSAEQQEQCPPESSVSRLVPQLRRTLDGIVDAVYSVGAAAKERCVRERSLRGGRRLVCVFTNPASSSSACHRVAAPQLQAPESQLVGLSLQRGEG